MHVRWGKHRREPVRPTSDGTHGDAPYAALINYSVKHDLKRNQDRKARDLRSCSSVCAVVLSGKWGAQGRPCHPTPGKPSAPRVLTRRVLLGRARSLRTAGRQLCKGKAGGGYKLETDLTLLSVFLYYAGQRKGINRKRT